MHQPEPNPFVGYVRDRALDFIDIVRFKLHAGSIGASVRATTLIQIGFVHTNGPVFGLERRAFGSWHEYRTSGGVSAAYQTDIETFYVWGNEFADPTSAWNNFFHRGVIRNGSYWDDGRDRPFSIGAEAHLGIGLDIGFYPGELLDFVLGIFTLDIMQDDLWEIAGDPMYIEPGTPLPPL
jgi:hypothetical protein